MTNEETKYLRQFTSDMLTIQNIANNPIYLESLTIATKEAKRLGIETFAQFQDFCGYVEELKGFTFENVTFLDRITDDNYSNIMLNTYKQISGQDVTIQLPENNYTK